MATLRRTRLANGAPEGLPQTSLVVAGPRGAVSLESLHVTHEVRYHSPIPLVDGDEPTSGCPYLDGMPCFTDADLLIGAAAARVRAVVGDDERTYDLLEERYHGVLEGRDYE